MRVNVSTPNFTAMKVPNINNYILALAGLMLMAAGCTTNVTDPVETPQNIPGKAAGFQVADMVIEGMTCQLSCAGRMYIKLDEMDGVGSIDIRFANIEGNDNHDRALVEFDPNKLTQDDLVAAVNAVGGGVYFVKSTTVTNPTKDGTSEGNKKNRSSDEAEVSYSTPSLQYELPNIFEVFTRLF